MEILRVENLCKVYGEGEARVEALKDVSFTLEKGEFAAVVGESGSGKSTLLNCIGGLDAPTSGKVWLDGEDLFSMTENRRTIFRRQNIGFVFQSFHLIEERTWNRTLFFPFFLTGENRIRRGWKNFCMCWALRNAAAICPDSCPEDSSSVWRSEER